MKTTKVVIWISGEVISEDAVPVKCLPLLKKICKLLGATLWVKSDANQHKVQS